MQDVDRIPAVQRQEAAARGVVVSSSDIDVWNGTVGRLEVRAERVLLVGNRHATSNDHPVEELFPTGAWHEVTPHSSYASKA